MEKRPLDKKCELLSSSLTADFYAKLVVKAN